MLILSGFALNYAHDEDIWLVRDSWKWPTPSRRFKKVTGKPSDPPPIPAPSPKPGPTNQPTDEEEKAPVPLHYYYGVDYVLPPTLLLTFIANRGSGNTRDTLIEAASDSTVSCGLTQIYSSRSRRWWLQLHAD